MAGALFGCRARRVCAVPSMPTPGGWCAVHIRQLGLGLRCFASLCPPIVMGNGPQNHCLVPTLPHLPCPLCLALQQVVQLKTFEVRTYLHCGHTFCCAFSPSGAHVASTGHTAGGHVIKIWDTYAPSDTASPFLELQGHMDRVQCIVYSACGRALASASCDRTVKLWAPDDGTLLATLQGHGGGVSCVAFSCNGAWLASGSVDRTVWLWDWAKGEQLAVCYGHGDTVLSCEFHPTANIVLSASRYALRAEFEAGGPPSGGKGGGCSVRWGGGGRLVTGMACHS